MNDPVDFDEADRFVLIALRRRKCDVDLYGISLMRWCGILEKVLRQVPIFVIVFQI